MYHSRKVGETNTNKPDVGKNYIFQITVPEEQIFIKPNYKHKMTLPIQNFSTAMAQGV